MSGVQQEDCCIAEAIENGIVIARKRVAAYVRVSTDGEEQLESFQSQKQYYQDKISKNKEWTLVDIYAGEILDTFDRVVFESIVDRVIVGEVNEDGSVDPFRITFVMKGNGNCAIPNAKEALKDNSVQKSIIQSA